MGDLKREAAKERFIHADKDGHLFFIKDFSSDLKRRSKGTRCERGFNWTKMKHLFNSKKKKKKKMKHLFWSKTFQAILFGQTHSDEFLCRQWMFVSSLAVGNRIL